MSSNPIAVPASEWYHVCAVPDALVARVLPAVPRGAACYLGPLTAERSRLLRQAGFEVDLGAFRPAMVDWPAPSALGVTGREIDTRDMSLPQLHYALVVLDGVLSLLSPKDGDRLVASVRRATRPGGVVLATALTVDDPAYEALRTVATAASRHAVRFEDGRWLRFHLRGELAMAFDGWMLLHAGDEAAPDENHRTCMMSVVVARRPMAGSLLA